MGRVQRINHLTAEQKRFICRIFAEYGKPVEVQKAVRAQYGFTLALNTIIHYRDSELWKPVILEMREALINHLADLPICSKFWRLKKAGELFETENRYRVTRYSGKSESPIAEKPVGELRQLLAYAAEELGELRQVVEQRGPGGGMLEYRVHFADGAPVSAAAVPIPAPPAGGSKP